MGETIFDETLEEAAANVIIPEPLPSVLDFTVAAQIAQLEASIARDEERSELW